MNSQSSDTPHWRNFDIIAAAVTPRAKVSSTMRTFLKDGLASCGFVNELGLYLAETRVKACTCCPTPAKLIG
jgi:hypothetical protein